MRRAEDPNPERRDPEPEDFETIREKLYLSRLTFAPKIYEASLELDRLNLGIHGRDYEIWKPILTIAKIIGEKVFSNVLSLAHTIISERKEELHVIEKTLLLAIAEMFNEKLSREKTIKGIEFSATDLIGYLKDLLLIEEYDADEKRFYKDWNAQKIGVNLTRMGLRKTRKSRGKRVYLLTLEELKELILRYPVELSHLSHLSQKLKEVSISENQPTKIEKTLDIFVGQEKGKRSPESTCDMCDKCDKQNEYV
mgnify:CR=1 FL=1